MNEDKWVCCGSTLADYMGRYAVDDRPDEVALVESAFSPWVEERHYAICPGRKVKRADANVVAIYRLVGDVLVWHRDSRVGDCRASTRTGLWFPCCGTFSLGSPVATEVIIDSVADQSRRFARMGERCLNDTEADHLFMEAMLAGVIGVHRMRGAVMDWRRGACACTKPRTFAGWYCALLRAATGPGCYPPTEFGRARDRIDEWVRTVGMRESES